MGCPLCPFPFLLIVEGLSKLIAIARISGTLERVKIVPIEIISHLLFIDDVLLFGIGSPQEYRVLKYILDLLCFSIVRESNMIKSNLI